MVHSNTFVLMEGNRENEKMLADQSYSNFVIKAGSVTENETLAEKRRFVT